MLDLPKALDSCCSHHTKGSHNPKYSFLGICPSFQLTRSHSSIFLKFSIDYCIQGSEEPKSLNSSSDGLTPLMTEVMGLGCRISWRELGRSWDGRGGNDTRCMSLMFPGP
ncbi:hypothetical protein SELMODRAFT_402578 [Selaginella moellendorffii]|uniref:Uncharacterized protein n=1 Tax=Selaginella moellendorffii TaxID=88036 RepID=D8QR45_SELML|nr:hypothetical protein SELMODRAFT_402578 [Selaginella moellendorffii]